jgi:hypothetical protein
VTRRTKLLICYVVTGIALVNFFAYVGMSLYLGGDAVNGGIRNGHYLLMSHGKYTEVSQDVFDYSRWHTYSLWITHPLALAAALWYTRIRREAPAK